MNILYHFMPLPPAMPKCVAELQEIEALRTHFRGELIYPNPNQSSPVPIPRLLFGLQRLRWLRKHEYAFDIHHVYNPDPFPYPLFKFLRRPVIYTISGGVSRSSLNTAYFASLAGIQVADEESMANLKRNGLHNGHVIRPGVQTDRYTVVKPPPREPFRILMASAPWTHRQFQSKGIDALLGAALRDPSLELVFLWRGVLEAEMRQRIEQAGLTDRVTIINRQVDINQKVAKVHATVALAATVGIMKAYPHSLLDSLAAGRPVLTNRAVPMSHYVESRGVGTVIEQVTSDAILAGIWKLRDNYDKFRNPTRKAAEQDFSCTLMFDSFRRLYESATNGNL